MKEVEYNSFDIALADYFSSVSDLDINKDLNLFSSVIKNLSLQLSKGHTCIQVNEEEVDLLKRSKLLFDQDNLQPFVLKKNNLYFYRYWKYEQNLIAKIKQMLIKAEIPKSENLDNVICTYFGKLEQRQFGNEVDWQREAARKALGQKFSIITGGPGTGKTTTVVKILACIIELAGNDNFLNIALAAPTGKAAARLQESIKGSKKHIIKQQEILDKIPESVSTIHKLLQSKRLSPYFKYNNENRLPFDVVVIDEASMVDIALMSKLLTALKDNTQLILLGDKDQLSSVEPGSILADLTDVLPFNTLELKKTFRFSGAIKDIAVAVNQQNINLAWDILQNNMSGVVKLLSNYFIAIKLIIEGYKKYILLVRKQTDYSNIFEAFNDFQVLCATNKGHFGVDGINSMLEKEFFKQGLIKNKKGWYLGKPIMINKNIRSGNLCLNNGDIGLCLADRNNNDKLMIFFEEGGELKKYIPAKLTFFTTAYAMTIHKSQGSEFKDVIITLPDNMSPIMTKELVYTGITRAKNKLSILTSKEVFQQSLKVKVERYGGIDDGFI